MQSKVVKLYDYMQTEIPDEVREWKITDGEILEALELLGKDHARLSRVESVKKGDSVVCVCTEGTDTMKRRTILLYPGRSLTGAEEAESTVIGCKKGDLFSCMLAQGKVTLLVKEIFSMLDMPVSDELVQAEEIEGVTTLEEFYQWYRKEYTPKKRGKAQQAIAQILFLELEKHTEVKFDEEEKKQWMKNSGENLYNLMIESGHDPHIPEDGLDLLSDEEALQKVIMSQEPLFKRMVICRYISEKEGYICSEEEFQKRLKETIEQGLMEEKDIEKVNFEMYAESTYEQRTAELLIKQAEQFLEE